MAPDQTNEQGGKQVAKRKKGLNHSAHASAFMPLAGAQTFTASKPPNKKFYISTTTSPMGLAIMQKESQSPTWGSNPQP